MCSTMFQSLFNIVLFVGFLFTTIALVTPGWATTTIQGNETATAKEGLVTYECSESAVVKIKDIIIHQENVKDGCTFNWDGLPRYQKAVVGLLVASILLCVAAMLWSCATLLACCLCCLKSTLLLPLPFIVALAAIANFVGCAVYASKHTSMEAVFSGDDLKRVAENASTHLGYSFVMAAIGGLFLLAGSVLACCLVKLNKLSPF